MLAKKQKYWCSFFGVVCLQDDYQVCCKLVAHATVPTQSLIPMCTLFNAHTLKKLCFTITWPQHIPLTQELSAILPDGFSEGYIWLGMTLGF